LRRTLHLNTWRRFLTRTRRPWPLRGSIPTEIGTLSNLGEFTCPLLFFLLTDSARVNTLWFY
jgi:hypothetical protein